MDAMESELEHLRSLLPDQDSSTPPAKRMPKHKSVNPYSPMNRSTPIPMMSQESLFAISTHDTEEQIPADGPISLPDPGPFDLLYSNPGIVADSSSSLTLERHSEPQVGISGPGTGSHRSAAKSILPESQPKTSRGYEWNEWQRISTARADGTASLSIEPDGQGYLGERCPRSG
jgi:hypothetical protein